MISIKEINKYFTLVSTEILHLNATIINCGVFFILVDSLLLPKDSFALSEYIKSLNLPLKFIINTHWHSDHCYGNKFIAQNETIIISHKDCLNTLITEKNMFKPEKKSIVERNNLLLPMLKISEKIDLNFPVKFSIIPTPGHSSDSICLYFSDQKTLISGDTILSHPENFSSIPYFFWGNPYQLRKSLKVLEVLDIETILSGHGEVNDKMLLYEHLVYLDNLINLFEQKVSHSNEDILKIKAEDCLPILTTRPLWVKEMHEFNLLKLYNLKMEL